MDGLPDLDQQELIARIEAIVHRMPRRTRDIFLAHRVDGLSYAEIAQRTGLTARRVERHMVRALVRLHRELHPDLRPWWKFW